MKVFLWTPGLIFEDRHWEMCRVQSLIKRRLKPYIGDLDLVHGLLIDWVADPLAAVADTLSPFFDVYGRGTPPEFGLTWGIRKPTHWAIHHAQQMNATHVMRVGQDSFIDDPKAMAALMLDALPTPGHWVAANPHEWNRLDHGGYCAELGIACQTCLYPNGAVMLAPLATWLKYYVGLPPSLNHHMDDVVMGEWMRQKGEPRIDWPAVWTHYHHAEPHVSRGVFDKHSFELAGVEKRVKLDIGCGPNKLGPDWTGVDLHVSADVKRPMWDLPHSDGSVCAIRCVHAMEHIGKNDVVPTLREWRRVLTEDGSIDIEVPDLLWCCSQWIREPDRNFWLDSIYGNQYGPGQFHRTGFTAKMMEDYAAEAQLRVISTTTVQSHGVQSLAFRLTK